ncbi:MAG: hypothetical protein KDD43_15710, partial [Bdellovibrionales bacterium]|nr:hypothetical protein [Bdellovibrionales bacterium]
EDGNQFLNNGSLLVARLEDQSHTQKAMLYEVGRFDELKYGQTSQLETLDLIPGAQSVATFAPQFNESEGMGYMRIHTVASSEPQLLSPAYGGRGTGTPCYFYQNDTGTHGSGAPENLINPSVTVAIPAPVIGEEWKHNYITVGGHPYPNSPDIEIRPFILSFWAKSLAPNPLPISPDGRCSWEIDLVDASSKNQWTYNDLQDAPQPMGNGEMVQTTLTPLDARWATIPEQINGRPADGERYYVQSLVKYFLCLEHDNPNVPSPTCVNTGLSSLTEPVAVQIGEVNAGFGIPHENLTGGQP